MGKYAIYTVCSNSFIEGCRTMLYSFLKHNPWFEGDIVISFDDKYSILSEENQEKLKSQFTNLILNKVNLEKYEPIFNLWKEETSARFLPSLYTFETLNTHDYHKILFLDSDILVTGDLSELFNKKSSFIGCTHNVEQFNTFVSRRNQDLNLGMLLVDHTQIKFNTFDKIIEFALDIKQIKYHDLFEQDIFNAFITNKQKEYSCLLAPLIYNRPAYSISDFRQSYLDNKILHYIGDKKPWENPEPIMFVDRLWYTYYNEMLEALK